LHIHLFSTCSILEVFAAEAVNGQDYTGENITLQWTPGLDSPHMLLLALFTPLYSTIVQG